MNTGLQGLKITLDKQVQTNLVLERFQDMIEQVYEQFA
ncbi:hypothetical protein NMY3_02576 [Candidatus Nitrosocosmicus oleophilus]|uniref:Uncharacterized protein n=1 Tax=Candidatus Nitrosocosmicus oleophilus TaxID=1353260 RepID=A0A654M0U3_9ARCH|nr:hypothetical protein NMY3_02576 [Candidatus Nitrosocosmicus oleophilus]